MMRTPAGNIGLIRKFIALLGQLLYNTHSFTTAVVPKHFCAKINILSGQFAKIYFRSFNIKHTVTFLDPGKYWDIKELLHNLYFCKGQQIKQKIEC